MQFKAVCCLKYLLQLCRKPRSKAFFFRHNPLALPYSPMGSLPSGQFQTTTELVRSLHCKWQSSQSISACLERGFPSPLIILVVFSFIMKKDFCPHDGFKLTWIYGFLVPWLPRFQIKKNSGKNSDWPSLYHVLTSAPITVRRRQCCDWSDLSHMLTSEARRVRYRPS